MAHQVAPPSTPYGTPIDIAAAKKAMAAAEAEAVKKGWGVAIAIVDSGANLVMLQRLDSMRNRRQFASRNRKHEPPLSFAARPRCSRMP